MATEFAKKVKFIQGICDEEKIRDILDKLCSNFVNSNFPLIDIVERNDSLLIFVELPGMDLNDFTIFQYDNFLVIEGVRKKKVNISEAYYLRMERQNLKFKRAIHIDFLDKLILSSAVLKDGVLTLEFKKQINNNFFKIEEE
jgi:HSP20 family protein